MKNEIRTTAVEAEILILREKGTRYTFLYHLIKMKEGHSFNMINIFSYAYGQCALIFHMLYMYAMHVTRLFDFFFTVKCFYEKLINL